MKQKKLLCTFFTVMFVILTITGCGKKESGVYGSWAYIHAKETAVAVFHKDGQAEYQGQKYTFEYDDQFIKLKNADGEITLIRYTLNEKGMNLYSNTTYTFDGEGKPDSLIGDWSCKESNWSFSFTESGQFMEDGYFPGSYTVDSENQSFALTYDDQFDSIVCYYQIEDNELHIQYPWQMVPTETK